LPDNGRHLWSDITAGAWQLMAFFGPLVGLAVGLLIAERMTPYTSSIIRRAGGVFAVRMGFKTGGSRGGTDTPRTANVKKSTNKGGGVS